MVAFRVESDILGLFEFSDSPAREHLPLLLEPGAAVEWGDVNHSVEHIAKSAGDLPGSGGEQSDLVTRKVHVAVPA